MIAVRYLTSLSVTAVGLAVLTACSGPKSSGEDRASLLAAPVVTRTTASAHTEASTGTTVSCQDARGDSERLDITSATLTRTGDTLTVVVKTTGGVPQSDTVGWFVNVASADGSKAGQLGYQLIDGREMSHFVFGTGTGTGTGEQINLTGGAQLRGGTLTVTFPWDFLATLGPGWTAVVTTTAAGADLDSCPDAGPDPLNPAKVIFE